MESSVDHHHTAIAGSEILSARQIPPGEYVAAQVTVDFTNAIIMVDDGTGTGVAVKPVDSSGSPLGQVKLVVQLDNKNDLKINGGSASRIALDFNLLTSNTVDLTAKTDTVSPVLVASVVSIDNKQVRVRGQIAAVDTANSNYTIQVDPFGDHDGNKSNPLVVHTTDATTFEINGMPFSGSAGLAQLATLTSGTFAVAFGGLQSADQTFTAMSVLAGTSLEGGGFDHIVGSVVARTGNTLTIHGARMQDHDSGDDHDGNDVFMSGTSTVTIGPATSVTAQAQSSATPTHTIAEISVGSMIDAFGAASKDSAGNVTLDASAGRVRLDLTRVQGALDASSTGKVTLSLSTIDHQPVSLFNFKGTGSSSDTDPTRYVLSTGALDLSPFALGNSVLGIGFVNPFGAAPPDFTALTIANGTIGDNDNCNGNSGGDGSNNCMCNGNSDGNGNGNGNNNCMCNGDSGGSGSNNCMCNGDGDGDSNGNNNCGCSSDGGGNCNDANAQLDIDWGNSGTATPFKSRAAAGLDLDRSNPSIGSKHEIQVNSRDIDIQSLATDVSIVGTGSGMTLFSISGRNGATTANFGSFADFEAALAADLNGTTTALRLTVEGQYNGLSNTFTAQRITILLSN